MHLYRKWVNHLTNNNMNYFEHLYFALYYGCWCLLAGLYLIIHSVFPCFYETAGSDLVKNLNSIFSKNETNSKKKTS